MMSVMSVISLVYLDTLSEAVVHVVLAPLTRPVQEVEILSGHVEPILVALTHLQLPSDLRDGEVFVRHHEERGVVNFNNNFSPGNQGKGGELLTVDGVVRYCKPRVCWGVVALRDPVIYNLLLLSSNKSDRQT